MIDQNLKNSRECSLEGQCRRRSGSPVQIILCLAKVTCNIHMIYMCDPVLHFITVAGDTGINGLGAGMVAMCAIVLDAGNKRRKITSVAPGSSKQHTLSSLPACTFSPTTMGDVAHRCPKATLINEMHINKIQCIHQGQVSPVQDKSINRLRARVHCTC